MYIPGSFPPGGFLLFCLPQRVRSISGINPVLLPWFRVSGFTPRTSYPLVGPTDLLSDLSRVRGRQSDPQRTSLALNSSYMHV